MTSCCPPCRHGQRCLKAALAFLLSVRLLLCTAEPFATTADADVVLEGLAVDVLAGVEVLMQLGASVATTAAEQQHLGDSATARDAAMAHVAKTQAMATDIFDRPNMSGPAAQVSIGLLIKSIDDIDMKAGMISLDLVMTLQWTDERASAIRPNSQSTITMDFPDAKELMWLPNVDIMNKDIQGEEVLSSSIKVEKASVTQIDRRNVRIRSGFDPLAFPFDSQSFRVQVASATHMSDALELLPSMDSSLWGAPAELFEGSEFIRKTVSLSAYEDIDGALHKSRAELLLKVDRHTSSYFAPLILPPLTLLIISATVFALPLAVSFANPRVVTSIMALVSLLMHRQSCLSLLPSSASLTWIEVFSEGNLFLIFFTLIFNVAVQSVKHRAQFDDLAETMNKELKYLFPALMAVHLLFCFCMACTEMVVLLSKMTRSVLLLTLVGYSFLYQRRLARLRYSDAAAV